MDALHRPRRDPSVELLTIAPSPHLAAALRAAAPAIIADWVAELREAIPSLDALSYDELRDSTPPILARIADVLEAPDAARGLALVEQAPAQGLTRFRQNYDVQALMTEDRLLRRAILRHVWAGMNRAVTVGEQVALDLAIDTMLQQAVVAFAERQQARLRAASEAELKYLSFISHDLNNNLGGVKLWLLLLREQLAASPAFATQVAMIDTAQQAIADTTAGMRRLLDKERLRSGAVQAEHRRVGLRDLATAVAAAIAADADRRGVTVAVDVPPAAAACTDAELVRLVLQNLLGNAVKFAAPGTTVRVRLAADAGPCVLSVSDAGPGIAPQHLDRIFDAFRRVEGHGQPGVGLGLTIAAQAANLLGATLTAESTVGVGSTFALTLPDRASGGDGPDC